MSSINIRFKRAIRKYEYLIEEISDTHEMLETATRSFNKALYSKEEKEKFSKDDEKTEIPEPNKIKIEPKYKKLYRKIVVKCHPDKIDKSTSEEKQQELLEIYESAVEAYDIGDRTPLIICAYNLKIDISDFEEDIHYVEESCTNLEKSMQAIQSTTAWYYEYVLKEEEKPAFIKKFIKTFGDTNIEDIQ